MNMSDVIGWVAFGSFIAAWVGIAVFGSKKGWSKIIAVGGGFIGACVGFIAITAVVMAVAFPFMPKDDVAGPGASEHSATSGRIATSDTRERLEAAALAEIYESKYSTGKRDGGLCDSVENARLENVVIGTISRTVFTGDLAKPLPAILAQHDFVCVNRVMGSRTTDEDQWVILALDDEFEMIRCVRTGLKDTVHQLARQCGFATLAHQ